MQVIGLCRFSYPAHGGFQIQHETVAERSAFLYQAKRMEDRFKHFETIMLPSISAQSDHDFTLVVVIGEGLPDIYQERLFDLCADVPQVIIQAYAPADHRETMQKAINTVRKNSTEPCLQFRHDDDDAIAKTFVESFRRAALDNLELVKSNKFVAFDFPRGYIVQAGAKGLYAEPTLHPLWGVALGISVAPHIRKSIMNFSHDRLGRFMPTLTFDKEPMYLRGHNAFNDSRQGPNVTKPNLRLLNDKGEKMILNRFAVDVDHIRRVFA